MKFCWTNQTITGVIQSINGIVRTLDEPYFEWMYGMMCDDEHLKRESYISLFRYLNDTEFTYDVSMNDGNRWQDGIDLRYSRFSDYME